MAMAIGPNRWRTTTTDFFVTGAPDRYIVD